MNETVQNILSRRSVRSFHDHPVTEEQIETLLRCAMAAPTAVNSQPWAFLVVRDRSTLDRLAANLPYAKMLARAPLAIIVCGDLTKALTGTDRNYWVQDCSAASENILLAARSMDLGSVWTAAFPYPDRMATVSETLHLPDYIIPLNVIAVGTPADHAPPKDKWNLASIHYERW